jgi:hypothetical protein
MGTGGPLEGVPFENGRVAHSANSGVEASVGFKAGELDEEEMVSRGYEIMHEVTFSSAPKIVEEQMGVTFSSAVIVYDENRGDADIYFIRRTSEGVSE